MSQLDKSAELRRLPSISELLELPRVIEAHSRHARPLVVAALRDAVDDARSAVLGGGTSPKAAALAAAALAHLARQGRRGLRRVVNATGVVVHTNLGRAPLSTDAAEAARDAAGYTNLEYDLGTGSRGRRGARTEQLLAEACEATAALVVNNGAAALVLVLAALAGRGTTIVSRGELVEIGGSFRLPEIMAAAGTRLHEVGTTNRTRPGDYARAINHDTELLLQVHPSNFRIVGFRARPTTGELARVATETGLPLVVDVGSGLLDDDPVLPDEPVPATVLAEGADLVVFSGDKLLGGPQAGAVVGAPGLIEACRRHPLARALRIDKLRLAALEVTLGEHVAGTHPPVRQMLTTPLDQLRRRAVELANRVGGEVIDVTSVVGGGSAPDVRLPSAAVALDGPADAVLAALRAGQPPVVGRIVDDRAVLDMRTVQADDLDAVASVVSTLRNTDAGPG